MGKSLKYKKHEFDLLYFIFIYSNFFIGMIFFGRSKSNLLDCLRVIDYKSTLTLSIMQIRS